MNGVILINFGGPRSTDEVYFFLRDIFRDVLPFPFKPLAKIFARVRLRKAQEMYSAIGGFSPVVNRTLIQAELLHGKLGEEFKTYIGMQYGGPTIDTAIARAKKDGAKKIIFLPLYPYQSKYTTSALALSRSRTLAGVPTWHVHPLYIAAVADVVDKKLIELGLSQFNDVHLIFSAHALPMWGATDYLRQIQESIFLILKKLSHEVGHSVAFQSAPFSFGWTGPSVKKVLGQNAKRLSKKHVVIVPLGFACENLETLYEIDQVYIPYALKLGIKNICRTQALNDHSLFIDLLKELVLKSVDHCMGASKNPICHPEPFD